MLENWRPPDGDGGGGSRRVEWSGGWGRSGLLGALGVEEEPVVEVSTVVLAAPPSPSMEETSALRIVRRKSGTEKDLSRLWPVQRLPIVQ